MITKIVSRPEEMMELGAQLVEQWATQILLYGDLGAGKTQFVKWIAKGLGISPDIVQSPTYTYLNVYQDKLLHIDMYRLIEKLNIEWKGAVWEELIEKWILEEIQNYPYVAIEWPILEDLYADKYWKSVEIQKLDENTREVIIS